MHYMEPVTTRLLTEAETATVKAWLTERCGASRCSMCGTDRWTVAQVLGKVDCVSVLPVLGGERSLVLLILECAKCANLVFLNSLQLGITPYGKPEPSTAEPSTQGTERG